MRFPLLGCFVIVLFTTAACGGGKGAASTEGLPPKRTTDRLLADVARTLWVPQTAEMKGDLSVDSPDLDISLKTTVRTVADSALWVTMRKFGFEGGRALVTRDSLLAINRLEREALRVGANDVPDDVRKLLPVEPSLANLQALFGGQPVGDWADARVQRIPGAYRLTLPAEPGAQLDISAAPQAAPIAWSYNRDGRYGRATFGDFREVEGGKLFPFSRKLVYSDSPGDTTYIDLQFESVRAERSVSLPMSIPANYGDMSL